MNTKHFYDVITGQRNQEKKSKFPGNNDLARGNFRFSTDTRPSYRPILDISLNRPGLHGQFILSGRQNVGENLVPVVTLRFINIYFSRMLFALLVSSVASNLIGTLHPSHLSQYKNKLTTAAGLADIYYLTQFDTGKYNLTIVYGKVRFSRDFR